MHEASLAQAVLDLALEAARDHGAGRITGITLAVGAMAEADAETLAFWVGILAEGGPAGGAAVRVSEVPAEAVCTACGQTYPVVPPRWSLRCERCGGAGELRSGRELAVSSIEVE
jgi:hydrogenase nickel incorporation protein HypA/HybF